MKTLLQDPEGVPPQQVVQAEVRLLQRLRQQGSELGAQRMARLNSGQRREGRSGEQHVVRVLGCAGGGYAVQQACLQCCSLHQACKGLLIDML